MGSTPGAKTTELSFRWAVHGHPQVENQSRNKHVEVPVLPCLDGGSTPPGSTKEDISKFVDKRLPIFCPNSNISLVENVIYLNKLVAFDYDIYEYRP